MLESAFGSLRDSSERSADALEGTLATADHSTPFVPIGPGAVDIAAGATATVVPANPGRVKVEVYHSGTTSRVWLGFGQTAQAGVGTFLDPGQGWFDYYAGAVSVLNAGASSVRVTFVEWGA